MGSKHSNARRVDKGGLGMPLQNTGTKTNKLKEYVNMDNQAENI